MNGPMDGRGCMIGAIGQIGLLVIVLILGIAALIKYQRTR